MIILTVRLFYEGHVSYFFGMLTKFIKATISFVMSVFLCLQ